MKPSQIVFLINDSVRAVKGRYEENGPETIFKTLDQAIKVDDLVVVQSGTRHNMTVVKISAVDVDVDFDHGPDMPWVVQVIDTAAFDETLAKEAAAIAAVNHAEKARKRAELRKSLFANHESEIAKLALTSSGEVTE